MKATKLFLSRSTILNTREKFSDYDEIDNERRRKKRIFTNCVHGDGVATTHHEFGMVFIHGDFGVSYCGNVFNYDAVIDFTAIFVVEEDLVRGNYVVDNRGFTDLFGAELTWSRQILSIVVSCH